MTEPIQVLLVEDNPADADLTMETLDMSKLHMEISVVTNGADAMAFLRAEGDYSTVHQPDLILLDLNLPGKDGREVLAEIKKDDRLRRIPVIILTSSEAEKDVLESYDLGANSYVTKPVDLKAFQTIVQSVESFWFTVVKLPPKGRSSTKNGG